MKKSILTALLACSFVFTAHSLPTQASPLGNVVFGNGSAQQIYPYIPNPGAFCSLAISQFGLTSCQFHNDGTATVTWPGYTAILSPLSTIQAQSGTTVPTSITLYPDLTLEYITMDGGDALLTTIAISS